MSFTAYDLTTENRYQRERITGGFHHGGALRVAAARRRQRPARRALISRRLRAV
jgi:hypothetical protein